jgi:hypothetical protein
VETGCRGGQGSPRAVASSGRKEGRKEGMTDLGFESESGSQLL